MRIAAAQLWVHDQDVALDFWTNKVGLQVQTDVTVPEMGDFRWLTVAPPGQDDVAIVLMAVPGEPMLSDAARQEVLDLVAKGLAGTAFLVVDDCRAAYEQMAARGVEFTEQPEERPYGVDCGFRDPSGNSVRLTEPRPMG